MGEEPVPSARDLQRYKGLLLEKQRELSSVQDDAGTRVPAAGGLEGDLIDQANADAEAELQIRLHQTDGRLLRAIEEALGRIRQAHSERARAASSLSLRRVCKRCLGRTSAVSARSLGAQPPEGVDQIDSQSSRVLKIKAEKHADYGQAQHSHA
jgi:hypothetical protein